MPDLLAACDTDEDFEEYDRIEADVIAREATRGRWSASTLGEVAEFFGAALQTVKQWRTESPPMPGVPGNYPLPEITRWRRDKDLQSDLAAAKRKQDFDVGQIALEQKQIELDEKKALILDRHDVELWAAQALVEIRESVMQLPEMLAASAQPDMRDFTREETDRHCRGVLLAASRRLDVMEVGKETIAE